MQSVLEEEAEDQPAAPASGFMVSGSVVGPIFTS